MQSDDPALGISHARTELSAARADDLSFRVFFGNRRLTARSCANALEPCLHVTRDDPQGMNTKEDLDELATDGSGEKPLHPQYVVESTMTQIEKCDICLRGPSGAMGKRFGVYRMRKSTRGSLYGKTLQIVRKSEGACIMKPDFCLRLLLSSQSSQHAMGED